MKEMFDGREIDSDLIEDELDDILEISRNLPDSHRLKHTSSKKNTPKASIEKRSVKSHSPPKKVSPQTDQIVCCICYSNQDLPSHR